MPAYWSTIMLACTAVLPSVTAFASMSKGTGAVFDLLLDGDESVIRILLNESGGHRYQRVPPTERRGRVHTSTVTVSVLEILPETRQALIDRDIQVFTTKDTGAGGQHRNKTESCVIMRHIPTGIEVKASARCQHQNRRTARALLESRVAALQDACRSGELNATRRMQVGSGMRADKIRTYRQQDDTVTDHRTGRKARYSDVAKGKLELLR